MEENKVMQLVQINQPEARRAKNISYPYFYSSKFSTFSNTISFGISLQMIFEVQLNLIYDILSISIFENQHVCERKCQQAFSCRCISTILLSISSSWSSTWSICFIFSRETASVGIIILRQLKILNWFKNNNPLIKRDLSQRVVYHYVIKRYIKYSYTQEIRLQKFKFNF